MNHAVQKGAAGDKDYLAIMKEIEVKEKLLKEKEDQFKAEAYEELKLTDDRQAQVDDKKAQLQKVLESMQQLDRDMDELDSDYDKQIGDLLKPDAVLGDLPYSLKGDKDDKNNQ